KHDILLNIGEISDRLYFVESGVLRAFYLAEGKDITRWFCFERHFAAAYFSFVYRQPSEDSIVAATDATLLSLSHTALQDLSQQDSVWVDLNRKLLEHYYTTLLSRVSSFQTQSTTERYGHLLRERPDIEEKVPLGQLASYLGMSAETLSRLRAKRIKQNKISAQRKT
ncbi:MAG: Crp/Fnr family transcriptional regulator, partial [Phormidesmis sp.]